MKGMEGSLRCLYIACNRPVIKCTKSGWEDGRTEDRGRRMEDWWRRMLVNGGWWMVDGGLMIEDLRQVHVFCKSQCCPAGWIY